MSSRKIRGLTRTGRQVSEDPDLDNLLSKLSAEEMEELEKDMMKGPDQAAQMERSSAVSPRPGDTGPVRDPEAGGGPGSHPEGRLGSREPSLEGEARRDSLKQEYLRKRGLSQEGNEDKRGGLQRQASVSTERDARLDSRGEGAAQGLCSRYSRRSELPGDSKETCEDSNVQKDRREARESTGSKTKDIISKLQEKKEKEIQEKEKREDSRRKDDSKTKDIISKLREKSEREGGKEKERKDEVRTRGRVSMLLEKQNKAEESQGEENKVGDKEQSKVKLERQKTEKDEVDGVESTAEKVEKRRETAEEVKPNDQAREEVKVNAHKDVEEDQSKERRDKEGKKNKCSRANEASATPTLNNCDGSKSPNSPKAEEEEDEDASMFDESMEQVRNNDPSLLELNVNNSEVIKVKTLIQFAEALHNNTFIKTFALANCRADDHVAYAIAGTLRHNSTITSINLDSNLLTSKGIMSIIQALQRNSTLTELRFHNQRHICGGKTEMEMTKILKDNTTLLKLGYHFELAGPRMTMTNILSRNMDRQRQKRLQEQKLAQANGEKKGTLEVPKAGSGGGSLRGTPKGSPRPSPIPSPIPSPKLTPKRGGAGSPAPPPPPPPPGGGPPPPPPPMLGVDALRNSLTPVSKRKMDAKGPAGGKNTRDQLLASIRGSGDIQLKKVPVPKWLQ